MELTHELRENAGFQWVLERLSPMSPFGKQAARNPRWYGPGDEAALEEELDNVALAMELWAAGGTRPQPVDSCGCEAPRVNPAELKDSAAALRGVPGRRYVGRTRDELAGRYRPVDSFPFQTVTG